MKISDLHKIIGGTIGTIDLTKRVVNNVIFSNNESYDNIKYEFFINKLIEIENVDPTSVNKEDILNWMNSYARTIKLSFLVRSNNDDQVNYVVKCNLKDDNILDFYLFQDFKNNKSTGLLDPLTGLYMRTSIEAIIEDELLKDSPTPFSLCLIDVDNFKAINDMYGHLFGDHILQEVSKIFKEQFENSYISRIGGDEFLIVSFSSVKYEDVWQTLHNLFERIRNHNFLELPKDSFLQNVIDENNFENFHVTITAGLSRFPLDGNQYDDLFNKSDKALYRGKRKGKNCYIIYQEEMHSNINIDKKNNDIINDRATLTIETILSNFVSTINKGDTFKNTIYEAIKGIGQFYHIDRIVVIQHDKAFEDSVVAVYSNPAIELASEKYVHKNIMESEDVQTSELDKFLKRTDVEHLKRTYPNIYEYFVSENVKSFVQCPLTYNESFYGYIRFDCVTEKYNWSEEEVSLFKIVGKILSLYVYNYLYTKKSEFLFDRDNLTGLLNHKATINKIDHFLATEKKYVIVYTDLYKFRHYNEHYGYQYGDNILRSLSKVLNEEAFLVCGRSNGDHFISMFEFVNTEDVKAKLDDIIAKFREEITYFIGGQDVTLLLGAYITDGKEGNSKACIDKSRLAILSLGKQENHCYQIYDEVINESYIRQTTVIQKFSSALKNNEFEVFLQPKVDATTNKIIGAEALTRWFTDGSYVVPDSFIPILEMNGLIEKLDLYVFENVMRFIHLLTLDNKEIIPISINISKKQNHVNDYVTKLDEIRRKYGVPTKYIEIEVTESSFANNYDDAILAMHNLRELGYKISLDDFGTGYSNLEVLSTGLFDVVKFDKSLIKDIEDDKKSKILLYSIELAKSLGLEIVCEGVETKSQRDIIVKFGGKIIQGFFYSKPISLYEFMTKYLSK